MPGLRLPATLGDVAVAHGERGEETVVLERLDAPAEGTSRSPVRLVSPVETTREAPRGHPVLAECGRIGFALGAVVPFAFILTSWGFHDAVAFVVVATTIWVASVHVGLMSSSTTLSSLGPRVAAARATLVFALALSAVSAWWPVLRLSPGRFFGLALVMFVLVSTWEGIVRVHLRAPERVLLVGAPDRWENVLRELGGDSSIRFGVVGIVADDPGFPGVLGATGDLKRIIRRERPTLVALVPGADRQQVFQQLPEVADCGFRVLELAQFCEYAFGRVPVRDLSPAWFMSVLHIYQRPYSRMVKRTVDLLGASFLLVFCAPLFPLLALMVKATPGPMLLRQVRVGEHGRLFTMYKFRSMRADAERPGEAIWASVADPRVTLVGKAMRRTRLDELPQIWNVLKGEMSFVGPRPERPEFVEQLLETVPYWTRRHLVKPGITGWAQVRHGYTDDADGSFEKLSYDLWYIRHRSLTVDLAICAETLAAIARGERRPTGDVQDLEPAFEPL